MNNFEKTLSILTESETIDYDKGYKFQMKDADGKVLMNFVRKDVLDHGAKKPVDKRFSPKNLNAGAPNIKWLTPKRICVHTDDPDYICPYCHYKKEYTHADNSVGRKAIFIRK
jgi:hypothetical protein